MPPISGGSSGAAVADGTYTVTNPLIGTDGSATTAPRSDMRPTVPTPATPTTQASADTPTSGAGTGFATDTHKHGMPTIGSALAIDEVLLTVTQILSVNSTSSTATANLACLVPLASPIHAAETITKILAQILVQSGNIDAGVYSWDGTTFTRVVSLGSTACPAAGNPVALDIADTPLTPGTRYFLALAFDNATASYQGANTAIAPLLTMCYTKAASFPLPATITTPTAVAMLYMPLLSGLILGGAAV